MAKNKPRHLLVLRTSAMGDVAMLPHALRALRAAYPNLKITVATRKLFFPFFTGLDVGLLEVDVRGGHRSPAGMWRLAREARRLGVDAVADVHGVLRSAVFRLSMQLHGVHVASIRKDRAGKRRFIRRGGRNAGPLRHTVMRYCDVFRRLGLELSDPAPVVRTELPDSSEPKTGRWVGFAPFSAHRGKTKSWGCWPDVTIVSSSMAAAGLRQHLRLRWSALIPMSRRCTARLTLRVSWS